MILVIYGGHKSISPWVFSTWSQGDGAAERCWSAGNALTRTNFHFASQEVALRGVSCWDLRLAVSSSTASAGPGDIPSSHPTDCSGSENSRFLALLGIFFFFWVAPTGGSWREVWGQSEIKVPRRWLQPRWLTGTQI